MDESGGNQWNIDDHSIVFVLDVGFPDRMELPIEFSFVVDDIFDVGVEFLRNVLELVSSSILEDICGLHFVALGHDVSA